MPHTPVNHQFMQHITVDVPNTRASHLFAARLEEIKSDVSDSRFDALKHLVRKHANSVAVAVFEDADTVTILFSTNSPNRTVEKRLRRAYLSVLDTFATDIPVACPVEKQNGATIVPYRLRGFDGNRLNRRK